MIQTIPIECPSCHEMVLTLAFRKIVNGIHFTACAECAVATDLTEEQILSIGFTAGFEFMKKKALEAISTP